MHGRAWSQGHACLVGERGIHEQEKRVGGGRLKATVVVLACVLSAFLAASGAVGLAWAEGDVSNGNVNATQETGQTEENASASEPDGSDKNAGTDSSQDESANANEETDSESNNSNDSDSDVSANAKANAPMAPDEAGSGAATVNGTSYDTVQAAINAASDGDAVIVKKDFGEQLTITKNITLDLGKHAYTYTGSGKGISITDNHIVPTIKNGVVSGCTSQAIYTSDAGVNLDNIVFSENSGSSYVVSVTDYGADNTFTWSNVTFNNNTPQGLINIGYSSNYTFDNINCVNNNIGSGRGLSLGGRGTAQMSRMSFTNNTGTNQLIDGMNLAINDSSFSGNKNVQSIIRACSISMNSSRVFDNVVSESTVEIVGWFGDYSQTNVTLYDSVIKNNTTTSLYKNTTAGLRTDYDNGHTSINNSAVYDNHRSDGTGSDFSFFASNYNGVVPDYYVTADNLKTYAGIDITSMKDPEDPNKSFDEYSITSSGEIVKVKPVYEAQIGETKYKKIDDAWRAAKPGDTIVIINTDQGGNRADLTIGSLDTTGKNVTVDLNGRNLGWDSTNHSLNLTGTGNVQIVNHAEGSTSYINGWVQASGGVHLSLGSSVELSSYLIPADSGNISISGPHQNLSIFCWPSYDRDVANVANPVTFANDFSFTGNGSNGQAFTINLATDNLKSDLNDHTTSVQDFIIAKGLSEDDASKLKLVDVTNPLVTLTTADGATAVHKATGAIVYLDGQNGEDEHNGLSKDQAVETFGKARDLVDAQLYHPASPARAIANILGRIFGAKPAQADTVDDPKQGYIIVCGTVGISGNDGDPVWEPTEQHPDTKLTLLRDPDFKDALVSVTGGKSLTLKNITLDGNSTHANATSSLVSVQGSTLNIQDGAVLCNNELTDNSYMAANGGAIHAERSTVNVEGGSISNNVACMGGGIYGSNSIINMSNGSIKDNKAVNDASQQALGGGIAAWYGTTVTLSGGSVTNNHSDLHGGGIALGSTYNVDSNKAHDCINMTGGSVSENVAEGAGGGIAIWSGTVDNYAIANISGGEITGNSATFSRNGNYFAGGGIYVDGLDDGSQLHDGELTLNNALITSNKAAWQGGGFAACPTSDTTIGTAAAIVGNSADGGNDIYMTAGTSNNSGPDMNGSPSYSVASRMYDGSPYDWVDDHGTAVTLDDLAGQLTGNDSISLTSNGIAPKDKDNVVIISGNSSGSNGGGIGSNGTVKLGGNVKTFLTVKKEWDGKNPPGSIQMHIQLGGNNDSMRSELPAVTLNADNKWTAYVEIPERASNFNVDRVKVTEDCPDGWTLAKTDVVEDVGEELDADDEDGWRTFNWDQDNDGNDYRISQTWTLANAKKPEPSVTIDPPVRKVVKGDASKPYPDFSFTLTADAGTPMPEGSDTDGDTSSRTVTVKDSGFTDSTATAELGSITFKKEGIYAYQVSEVLPDGVTAESPSKDGWMYDTHTYTLKVHVEKDGDGLKAWEEKGVAIQKDSTDNVMTFTNSYKKAAEPQTPGGEEPKGGTKTPAGNDAGGSPSPSEPTPEPASPVAALLAQTGDANPVALTAVMAVLGAALVALALWVRRRRHGAHYSR